MSDISLKTRCFRLHFCHRKFRHIFRYFYAVRPRSYWIRWNNAKLEMWASAQRDGCPAEYRWRPLFNAAKFGWCPTTRVPYSNAAKKRNPLKFAGVPQTRQQISAVSSPKFTILSGHVEEVLVFNKFFFRLSINALVHSRQNGDFLHPVFPASRVQHISHLHSKFALRPHYVWKYGIHPICGHWD